MQLKKGEIVEVTIHDLAFGGMGVGRITGEKEAAPWVAEFGKLAVFVPGVVPGDTISARLTRIKKQYLEAVVVELLKKSPERIAPRCRHFGVCGGCSLQFLSYQDQLKWKEKMVRDAIRKFGGFDLEATGGPELLPIIGCEDPWFYRNKMEYTFGDSGKLGMHPAKNFREVFDLQECFLQSPDSVKILDSVRAWAAGHKLSSYDPRNNTGVLRNLVVREAKNTGEVMVILMTASHDFALEKEFAELITRQFPQVTSLYRTAIIVRRGTRTAIENFLLHGKKTLTEELHIGTDRLRFEILPHSFFQTNSHQTEILYKKVLEFGGVSGSSGGADNGAHETVLDLFCGTGTIGMFFAKSGATPGQGAIKKVVGVELSKDAIENAHENAALNHLTNIEFFCGDAGKLLPTVMEQNHPTIIVTDPPRAGIAPHALEKIIELKIPTWIYVSCNPTTLARDLKIICTAGYKLKKIQPIDMFPQTYHVETVCLLTR